MPGVLFLDLAPGLTGWAAIDGESTPVAAAWRFANCGEDLGQLLEEHAANVEALIRRFDPDAVGYESPILGKFDKLWTIRRIYSLGGETEHVCRRVAKERGRPLPCREASLYRLKKELAGFSAAKKPDMVAAALKLGVDLPETKEAGREDAADAVAGALVLLREFDRSASAYWDKRLWSSRGALL